MLNDLFDFYFIGCCGGAGFSQAIAGIVFEYELLDEDNSGNGFGLFYYNCRPDRAPPAFRTPCIRSTGFGLPAAYRRASGLTPSNGPVRRSKINLLQKRNGTFEIILQI